MSAEQAPTPNGTYPEPPPGWSATTPYGAPWPYDPAVLDRPELGSLTKTPLLTRLAARPLAEPLLVSRLEPLAELEAQPLRRQQADREARAHLGNRAPRASGLGGLGIRRLIWAGGVAMAVILAIGSVLLSTGGRGHHGRLAGSASRAHSVASTSGMSLPRRIGSYVRAQQSTRDTLTSAESFAPAAHTAVYQRNGKPGLTAGSIGIDVGYVRGSSAGSTLRRIYQNFKLQIGRLADGQANVGKPRAFPAGPLHGRVSCWRVTAPSGTGSGRSAGAACLWADNDTFGFLLAPGLRTSNLATTLLMFRSAIEMSLH